MKLNSFCISLFSLLFVFSDVQSAMVKRVDDVDAGKVKRRSPRGRISSPKREIKVPTRYVDESQLGEDTRVQLRDGLHLAKKKVHRGKEIKRLREKSPASSGAGRSKKFKEPALSVRESEYLASVGVPGQQGLYADQVIREGQFLGWYEGKIYFSVRDVHRIVPRRDGVGTQKEFSYFFDVKDPQSYEYLYTVDAFQPKEGSEEMCLTAYINHKPQDLANSEFRSESRADAPGGLAPAVFATRRIEKGEEIIIDYGPAYERHLQAHAPGYLAFLRDQAPDAIIADLGENHEVESPLLLSRLFELLPALMDDLFTGDCRCLRALDERLREVSGLERTIADALDKSAELNQLVEEYGEFVKKSKRRGHSSSPLLYQAYQRLAYAQWRLALVHLGLELHASNRDEQLNELDKRMSAVMAASQSYQRAIELKASSSIAFRELGQAIQELGGRPDGKEFSRHEKRVKIEEDFKSLETEANAFREEAELILLEDSNPLKSHDDKVRHRRDALDFYHFGLYLIEAHFAEEKFQILKAHFKWGLAEAYLDEFYTDLDKAYPLAKEALREYQAYVKRPGKEGQCQEDIQQAQETLSRAQALKAERR